MCMVTRSSKANCLKNSYGVGSPLRRKVADLEGKLPGQLFSREEQCKVSHGLYSKPCVWHVSQACFETFSLDLVLTQYDNLLQSETSCGVAWCSTSTGRCITFGGKWAEGTKCGEGKVNKRGLVNFTVHKEGPHRYLLRIYPVTALRSIANAQPVGRDRNSHIT